MVFRETSYTDPALALELSPLSLRPRAVCELADLSLRPRAVCELADFSLRPRAICELAALSPPGSPTPFLPSTGWSRVSFTSCPLAVKEPGLSGFTEPQVGPCPLDLTCCLSASDPLVGSMSVLECFELLLPLTHSRSRPTL